MSDNWKDSKLFVGLNQQHNYK